MYVIQRVRTNFIVIFYQYTENKIPRKQQSSYTSYLNMTDSTAFHYKYVCNVTIRQSVQATNVNFRVIKL